MPKRIGQYQRKRLPPMSIEPILDSPEALAMSPAQYGGLMRILHHYWQTGCQPISETDMRLISRLPRWSDSRDVIQRLVESIGPAMWARYQLQQARIAGLRAVINKGAEARRQYAAARRNQQVAYPPPAATSKRTAVVAASKVESRSQEASRFSD